jgi:hypothetical protein
VPIQLINVPKTKDRSRTLSSLASKREQDLRFLGRGGAGKPESDTAVIVLRNSGYEPNRKSDSPVGFDQLLGSKESNR